MVSVDSLPSVKEAPAFQTTLALLVVVTIVASVIVVVTLPPLLTGRSHCNGICGFITKCDITIEC